MKLEGVTLSLIVLSTVASASFPSGRVIGGNEAAPGQFPFQCLLQFVFEDSDWIPFCGSSAITSNHILTAAHCVYLMHDMNITMRANCGKFDITVNETTEQPRLVKNVIFHPQYKWEVDNYETLPWDLAILKLAEPLAFNKYVQPIAIAPSNHKWYAYETATLLGWGIYKFNDTEPIWPDRLQYSVVGFINQTSCAQTSAEWIKVFQYFVCVGSDEGGVGSCDNDSGGILFQETENGVFQIGVASWAIRPCGGPGLPSGYVEVQQHLNWITNITTST